MKWYGNIHKQKDFGKGFLLLPIFIDVTQDLALVRSSIVVGTPLHPGHSVVLRSQRVGPNRMEINGVKRQMTAVPRPIARRNNANRFWCPLKTFPCFVSCGGIIQYQLSPSFGFTLPRSLRTFLRFFIRAFVEEMSFLASEAMRRESWSKSFQDMQTRTQQENRTHCNN